MKLSAVLAYKLHFGENDKSTVPLGTSKIDKSPESIVISDDESPGPSDDGESRDTSHLRHRKRDSKSLIYLHMANNTTDGSQCIAKTLQTIQMIATKTTSRRKPTNLTF